jgi:hypothetical protein
MKAVYLSKSPGYEGLVPGELPQPAPARLPDLAIHRSHVPLAGVRKAHARVGRANLRRRTALQAAL